MAIPNYKNLVEATKNEQPRAWNHAHIEGDPERWDFVILCARKVYATDSRFGCNGKRGNPDDLSMDALNWIGTATDPTDVIDIIVGAGGSNPQPGWGVTNSTGAFVNPNSVKTYAEKQPIPPKIPSYESLGGDAAGNKIGNYLFHDYNRGGQPPNPGMGTWFNRCTYDAVAGVDGIHDYNAAIAKHRPGWCGILGIPVDNYDGN